ncbi:MAG: hypothetical protein KGI84_01730 [Elusimicrobia bacterium]|nr:hypothetical protein [Elusimicrobiota bacterium]
MHFRLKSGACAALLAPYPPKEMEAWDVSSKVNSTANDAPALVSPV